MKNRGPFLAFDKRWFQKHQKPLLSLLNNHFTKRWFRWVLNVRVIDCAQDVKISSIGPDFIKFGNRRVGDRIDLSINIRTFWVYSKNLYEAFKPLWWAMHYWDEFFADKHAPQWSFG